MTTEELIKLFKPFGEREFDLQEAVRIVSANRNIYWSWGVSRAIGVRKMALALRVHGHHHNGYVLITLACNDTFTVRIVTTAGQVLETFTDVYVDQLTEVIDNRIERIPEYKR